MIEFKAGCGHTVRAKDEDAGGVVRCSYCGRAANVPEPKDDSLDFLFQDLDQSDDTVGAPIRRKRRRSKGIFSRRRGKELDPFAVVLRLCYAALLIIIVIVVGRKFVGPLLKKDGFWQWRSGIAQTVPSEEETKKKTRRDQQRPEAPAEYGSVVRLDGLHVVSTPPGATGYWLRATDDVPTTSIAHEGNSSEFRAGGKVPSLAKGHEYIIEVMFALRDPKLVGYPGYNEFSRDVMRAADTQRRRLVNDFFLPDGADKVFVDRPSSSFRIVRRYRVIVPKRGLPTPIRALFLPRVLKEDGVSLNIEALLQYIPNRKAYRLDEDYVKGELNGFYGVPEWDELFVREGLERIGIMPYFMTSRRSMLFTIAPQNGQIEPVFLPDQD